MKTTTPARNSRRRPKRSAARPPSSRNPPNTQRVGVDDPLQRAGREVQVGLQRGQGDVHDRRVEDDHELAEADDGEHEPGIHGPAARWCERGERQTSELRGGWDNRNRGSAWDYTERWFRLSNHRVGGSLMAVEQPPRKLRADAARNRERVLEAAREVFAEHGVGVPIDDVAAAPAWASAPSTGTSRPRSACSRRSWSRASSGWPPPPAGRARPTIPARRSTRSSGWSRGAAARTWPWPTRWPTPGTTSGGLARSQAGVRAGLRGARRRAQAPARCAPTSSSGDIMLLSAARAGRPAAATAARERSRRLFGVVAAGLRA